MQFKFQSHFANQYKKYTKYIKIVCGFNQALLYYIIGRFNSIFIIILYMIPSKKHHRLTQIELSC